ncbi:hypothetical protein [Bacillus seohaeanensis]|uniref:Uncharacterized protein n=1 Tax=Bacillus seohaeanensis TaxID=284580 RepID=A0ABW5RPT5_9BACI
MGFPTTGIQFLNDTGDQSSLQSLELGDLAISEPLNITEEGLLLVSSG